ncbi:hypothetical protein [Sphingopyxis sp. DBS4]|uniref:hypothetical protein n=1 Tax=Sphingopyxis sp. DBS4 TaxID=2968500 RepID=UPI00214CA3FA|nr:hypothetical protein [Sphingopyxis sp. DBS4]
MATLVAIGATLGLSASDDGNATAPHVVPDGHCEHSGINSDGGIQFLANCPQSSLSPDGRWKLIQTSPIGAEEVYDVVIETPDGKLVGHVPDLNDHMPFALYWSPRSDWFMINHYRGSGLQRPRVFQITGDRVIEYADFLRTGEDKAREISPCLPSDDKADWMTGDGLKWSRDGSKLAWAFRTRIDMCVFEDPAFSGPIPPDKQGRSFLMISDVATGKIVDGSVRLLPDDEKWRFPTDGPYRGF